MMPAANNMEAIWAVTLLPATCVKLYTQLSTKISVWMVYFMGLHVAKHPGVHFRWNFTLMFSIALMYGNDNKVI